MKLSLDYVNKILGFEITDKEIIDSLKKMGYVHTVKQKNKEIKVLIPPWRADILHEIDIIEDVSIGYGYEKFKTEFPKALTFGKILPNYDLYENLKHILIGLGFNEVTTFTISNPFDEFKKMGLDFLINATIENPIAEEYSCLRISLIPSLLKILNENRHREVIGWT